MENMKSVGIWIRVSTEDQARGESPEHHEMRARHYAEAKGWNVHTVYHLEAVSGKSVMNHPEAKRMLKEVRGGTITGIIFSKLARLARNTRELLDFADIFKECNADLISLQEAIDTSTPAGRMFFTVQAALTQFEREEIAERVSASVPVRAKMQKPLGGQASFGYRWDRETKKLVIDEKEAPVRKLVFELFLKHKRKKSTAKELNAMGHRTRNGSKFSDTTIDRLIRDTAAMGQYRANYTKSQGEGRGWKLKPPEEWVITACPAIVDEDTWRHCNAILDDQLQKRKKVGPKAKHLLAGYVHCGCGKKMYVFHDNNVYACKPCKNRIPAADLDAIYLGELGNYVVSEMDFRNYLDRAEATLKEREILYKGMATEAERVRKRMDDLVRMRLDGELTKEAFATHHRPLEEQLSQIHDQMPKVQADIDFLKVQHLSSDKVFSEAASLKERWETMAFEERRGVVEAVTESIKVGKDEISFRFAYAPTSFEMAEKGNASMLIRVRGELQVMGPPLACANTITGFGTNPFTPCTWNTTPTGPSIIGSPGASISVNWNNIPGNYLVTAVPVNPNAVCNDAAAAKITVVAVPPAPDIMGDTIVCPNSTYSYCSSAGNVNWTVTGGTPSSGIGSCITVTWNNTGPYSVQAFQQLPNAPNCMSPITTQNVYSILPLPAPSINSGATCTNNTSTLTCVTLYPAGTTYNWIIIPNNAGAITSGQGTNVINIEWGNNAGPVQVQLTVTACSQQISTTASYNLSPAPNPAINQIGLLCPGVPAQLNATGGVFTAYAWSGPLAYTSAVNPTSIIAGGLYHVTVTDNNGCTASTQYTAIPQPGPMASISTADPLSYCIGTSFIVQLNALTNPGYTFNWSNGPTINPINVTSPGTYSVTVTDANGCTALSNFITITQDSCNGGSGNPCIPNGTVSFAHPIFYGCNPLSFTNTSSINASNFSWNFGDLTGANTYNATHTYTQAGFYLVTLSGLVPNTAGTDSCVLTDTAQVEVPLAPAFKYVVGCLGTPVQFTDLSAYIPGNNITSWNWSFGDATFSTMQSPPHVYASAGTYTVTLTVGNGTCNASITQVITILPLPVAAFNYPLTACVNSPVPFTDASTPIGAINQWNWDFGDAGTSLNQNPTHSYLLPITYNVQLIVRDTLGCKDTVTQSISIVSPSPVGNIIAFPDTIVCAGTSVDLVAPFCIGCTYVWSNNSTNDTTTVATSGIYSVTITDPNGCAATSFIHIIVNPAPPAIIINSGDADLCLGESTYLSTISSPNYLYYWISNDTFVDGYTGSGINVLSDSIGTGVFTYQVIVTDTTTGCFDTSQVYTITVHPNPVPPVITVLGSGTICKGDTVMLIGTHPDPNVQLQWSNGETNDTIYATVGGLYTLTAVDTNGCDNTASTSITVNPMPEACCFWTGCLDTCNPYTMYAPAGNTSYQWLLNDSIIPGATNVPYTATVSGSYSVIVTNSFGCTDTLGDVELNLYMCHDSICADLEIDSVGCDSSGNHVVWYHIMNTSGHTINEITFTVLQPNQNTLFGPVSVFENIPNGGMSSSHSATFYNTNAGDTLCFKAYVHEMDSMGMEMFCCNTDTECVVLPPCPEDTSTNCCYFKYDHTSINCEQSPNGYTYNISIFVDACGQLNLQLVDTGTALFANPYIVNGPTTITFNYTTPTPQSNICLIFLLYNGTVVCKDTNICIPIECDPVVQHPECDYSFKDSICVGQTNSYIYNGPTAGLTFNWNFLGGMPATATGPGPHIVTYNTAGCFMVSVTITGGAQTVTCRDSMCVVPAPVASITQSGPTLFASPGGYNYQWYSGQPLTLLPGQNNQFYNPPVGGVYCVEVISDLGCRDTACIDFNGEVGINEALMQSLQVYPSPADEWLKVNAAIQAATVVDLKLINGVGALVYERTVDASSGININIPLKQLPSGIYLLQINAGPARFTEKVFIQHR